MPQSFEFELVFQLVEPVEDRLALADAVFAAGFDDAVVGVGNPRLLAVSLELDGEDAETVILEAAAAILKHLPAGSRLREIQPDLVSLAEVAERLNIKRQALQKRADMPLPSLGGLYRIDELADAMEGLSLQTGRNKPRFDITRAANWFNAGRAARRLNARLAIRDIDPVSLKQVP